MLHNQVVFIVLLVMCGAGLALGVYYFYCAEKIVLKRLKDDYKQAAKSDQEFNRWLNMEIQTQVNRARKMGLTIVIFEAIWLVLVFALWQKYLGS